MVQSCYSCLFKLDFKIKRKENEVKHEISRVVFEAAKLEPSVRFSDVRHASNTFSLPLTVIRQHKYDVGLSDIQPHEKIS